jgi:molybdopterin/thiamine biosynthesis adenylyltransferase
LFFRAQALELIMHIIEVTDLMELTQMEHTSGETVIRLIPKNWSAGYYRERTDRNIGWITAAEQELLRESCVGIAGTGGMGGLLAAILVRAGVGEIRIADSEVFDVSNLNRQFAATGSTIGESKAVETARAVRSIATDTTVVVYPQGITEETVRMFIEGCDVICDEIEVLAVDSRILLHQQARRLGVSLFNCNTAGFSTNLFLYTLTGIAIEDIIGFGYEEAKELRRKAEEGNAGAAEKIALAMVQAVVPQLPEYRPSASETDTAAFWRRLLSERKVSIIATNPPMATGFLADRILLYLLRNSGVKREIVHTPEMPHYLHFDAAHMRAFVGTGEWNQ